MSPLTPLGVRMLAVAAAAEVMAAEDDAREAAACGAVDVDDLGDELGDELVDELPAPRCAWCGMPTTNGKAKGKGAWNAKANAAPAMNSISAAGAAPNE